MANQADSDDSEEKSLSFTAIGCGCALAIALAAICILMLVVFEFNSGLYVLVVQDGQACFYHTVDGGLVAGPFRGIEAPNGAYVLTGNEDLEVARVLARDETVRPGYIKLELSGMTFDVQETGVIFDFASHLWQPKVIPPAVERAVHEALGQ